MKKAFVIMQIGDADLDRVFTEVFVPALEYSGLDPKRVDKHNEGRLLKSEIVNFISDSDIIVADLTNERPNCYLEIGYAMGLDKFTNLILTAREDHNHDSPNYVKGGPKIHFDLSGYDILFWDTNKLTEFKEELEKRIKRRLATLPSVFESASNVPAWDEDWIAKNREIAMIGLKKSGNAGYMEIIMKLPDSTINVSQAYLLQAAHSSQIHAFGSPIGLVLNSKDEFRPKPKADGIVAEISTDDKLYDYWALRKNGSYYLLKSLFEDTCEHDFIYFNTRIVRITEAFLHAVRLYRSLNVKPDSRLLIGFRHGGLKGRHLNATPNRRLLVGVYANDLEDAVYEEVETAIEKVEADLVALVERIVKPLFSVFDYYQIDKAILEEIVTDFVNGKVT
jgi:hypothetical protein